MTLPDHTIGSPSTARTSAQGGTESRQGESEPGNPGVAGNERLTALAGAVLLVVHHAGFLVFTALVGIHALAYIGRVPGLIAGDWRRYRIQQAPGRGYRLAVNLAALILGLIAAILVLPAFDTWIH